MRSDKPKTCALMISTYNWPEALRLVFESVRRQTRIPDEVLIADDGSGEKTRELIEDFQKIFPCPLIHVWQEDKGFRKCIIWNKTIERVSAEYAVQIDGDCILAPRFIEDHLKFARNGWFTCGSRTLLTEKLTREILAAEKFSLSPFSRGVRNRVNALRIPPLSRFFRERYRAKKPYISKGCNVAFWTRDLLAVNGYNENISGWGREDAEIEVRLMKLGIRRQSLKFGATQYHLHHTENDRSNDARNIEILNRALASPDYWTPNGIVKSEKPNSGQTSCENDSGTRS